MAEKVSRNRSTNFTFDEKTFLFTTVSKYKHILENKKTDAVTNNEKLKTWDMVAREFNSISPSNVERPAAVLKRFYENQKKELRKKCANKKMHVKGNGGGPPLANLESNSSDDLLLSIINEKTVFGMNPPFGGDADRESEDEEQSQVPAANSNIEFVFDESINIDSSLSKNNMELDTCETEPDLLVASTSADITIPKKKTWATYTPSDLEEKLSTPLKKKIKTTLSQEETIPGPSDPKTPNRSCSRRRPATVVKSLTSSDIGNKYNKLLDERLEIVALTKKELEQKIHQNAIKHESEMILLNIQIEIEKEKLKKIKSVNS